MGSQSLVDPVTGSGPFYCNKKMDCRCMKQGCQNKACKEQGGKCMMPSDDIPFGYYNNYIYLKIYHTIIIN